MPNVVNIWSMSACLIPAVVAMLAFGPRVLALVPRDDENARAGETCVPVLWRRAGVVAVFAVPGTSLGALLAWSTGQPALLFWAMAGPFAEPMLPGDYGWPSTIVHGALVLAACSLHPFRPNWFTPIAIAGSGDEAARCAPRPPRVRLSGTHSRTRSV
jgi:hypothetical protein